MELSTKPRTATAATPISTNFSRCAIERLVVTVGDLAAERGQEEIRRDEHRARERDQRLAMRAADMEQNEKDERILEEIIVECGKELRPEQRREAPRQHQKSGFRVHDRTSPRFLAGLIRDHD